MPACPNCNTPGAYIGFNSVECLNPRCVHYTVREEEICPCCGKPGHIPGPGFTPKAGKGGTSKTAIRIKPPNS